MSSKVARSTAPAAVASRPAAGLADETAEQVKQERLRRLQALIQAQAQAISMQTADFERAYRAILARENPIFEGN